MLNLTDILASCLPKLLSRTKYWYPSSQILGEFENFRNCLF